MLAGAEGRQRETFYDGLSAAAGDTFELEPESNVEVITDDGAMFDSALKRNRGGPSAKQLREKAAMEQPLPTFDFTGFHEQLMANRPRVEDLPF